MSNAVSDVLAAVFRLAIAAGCSGAVLSAAVAPARAAEDDGGDVKARVVTLSDLDLTKPGERATLDRRLANAARVVCSDSSEKGLDQFGGFQDCYIKTLSDSRKQARVAIAAAQRVTVFATAR